MIRALCASLLLFAMSWAASADNAKPLTTMLLVAQAELRDPEQGREEGLKQFLDEKSIKPGLESYRR